MFNPLMNESNNFATQMETIFNYGGAIPALGVFSSLGRAVAAKAQVVAGVVFSGIGVIGYGASLAVCADEQTKRDFKDLTWFGITWMGHGISNVIRSHLEIAGQIFTLAIGTIFFNLMQEEEFAPVVSYARYGYGPNVARHTSDVEMAVNPFLRAPDNYSYSAF